MKYLYVLLAFSFLFSCKDENKKHAESVLREWMNKEIVFPNKMYFSIQGKENVDFRIKIPNIRLSPMLILPVAPVVNYTCLNGKS